MTAARVKRPRVLCRLCQVIVDDCGTCKEAESVVPIVSCVCQVIVDDCGACKEAESVVPIVRVLCRLCLVCVR